MRSIASAWKIFSPVAILLLSAAASWPQAEVVAYVPNWIDLPSFAETIDYSKLTHINIAFENPLNAEGDLSFSSKNEALIAKAHENRVKVRFRQYYGLRRNRPLES